jgi:LmbE family N-acetylglucosaminyl deacetylase
VADTASHASGTMAIHADLGDRVVFAICTDSVRMHPTLFLDAEEAEGRGADLPYLAATVDEMRELRRREARRVAAILGVNEVVFMGWEDDGLEASAAAVEQVARLILEVRPDLLVTHLPHADLGKADPHVVVAQITNRARHIAASRMRQVDGIARHQVKELIYFPLGEEVANSRDPLTLGIVCDIWVDITSVVDRKVQALDQILSQGYQGRFARKIVEARDGSWGILAGVSYAEPFLRSAGVTYPSLPMPESVLNAVVDPAGLPELDMTARDVPSAVAADGFAVPVDGGRKDQV